MKDEIMCFHTIGDLQSAIISYLQSLKKRSEEYSQSTGDKLRSENTSADGTEMAELKEKLEGSTDPKKRKTVKKKDQKTNWFDFGAISIYDGIDTKGELEIHFRALEEIKSKIEKLEKIRTALDDLISKGVKRDLSCTVFLNQEMVLQISFTKASQPKAKFSFKSTFSLPQEIIYEIKI